MLRTNSKIVRERIKDFIIENYNCGDVDFEKGNEPKTFSEIAKHIYAVFQRAKFYSRGYGSEQELFEEWCSGLPSVLHTYKYYLGGTAVKIVGDILEQSESERARFCEGDAEKLMCNLIYREIIKEVRK